MAIEQTYGIKIRNREEAARFIADNTDDPRRVLAICTSLNSWIAINNCQGEFDIPSMLLNSLLERA